MVVIIVVVIVVVVIVAAAGGGGGGGVVSVVFVACSLWRVTCSLCVVGGRLAGRPAGWLAG